MNMDNICVVLSRPENSGNVGSVCRAMANCDVHDLRIVGRRDDYDDGRVRALALHAAGIWEAAQFFATITDATRDCAESFATTRRRGKKRKSFLMLIEEVAKRVAHSPLGRTAMVFGNERTGLTDDEINECTSAVVIPSSDTFASLNLSHAVQVVCYCLYRETIAGRTGWSAIDLSRLDQVTEAIAAGLQAVGFFSMSGAEGMNATRRFFRDVLSRADLSEGEAQYMEHIFKKMRGICNGSNGDGELPHRL